MTNRHPHADERPVKAPPSLQDDPQSIFFVPPSIFTPPAPKADSESGQRALNQLVSDLIELVRGMRGRYVVVTTDDIRELAVQNGLLREKGVGREYSLLGTIPKRAGLVSTGQMVRSKREGSHGTPIRVWTWEKTP